MEDGMWGWIAMAAARSRMGCFFHSMWVGRRKAAFREVDTGVLNTLVYEEEEPVLHTGDGGGCSIVVCSCRFGEIICCAKVCV